MGSQELQINKAASSAVKTGSAALIIGIIFLAANMRAPLTSVGPLVGDIRSTLSISNMAAGILTTLPLLAFALLSPFAPKLSRRFGMERVLFTALIMLAVGIVTRSASGTAALFTGTALIGIAISVCNVLLPGLIKQEFPQRIGVVTGIYSVAMNLCGAAASGISIPLAESLGLGWKGALGCWGILALAAMAAWTPQLKGRHRPAAAAPSAGMKRSSLWKSSLAWQVTLFMGMQSFIFYVTVAWLPEILTGKGMAADTAGWMLFLMQFSLLPFTFIVPIVAAKMTNQRLLVVISAVLFAAGIGGFLFDAPFVALWTVLLGIGASPLQTLRSVVLPMITHAVTICFFLTLNGAFKVFEVVYGLTGGGPGRATQVITMNIYEEAFSNNFRYGYASAKSVILFVIVLIFTLIQITVMKKREVEA